MNYSDLEDFSMYNKEIPCVNCKKPAKPTVVGDNFKCTDCMHIFKEDGSKITVDCYCKKCAPKHDPLKGKTKGKKAELVLPDKKKNKKEKRIPPDNLAERVANNVANMFPGSGPVPIVKKAGKGKWKTKDVRTGKTLHTSESYKLPDGKYMESFKSYPVRLLKRVTDGEGGVWKKGDESFHVQMTPGGSIALGKFCNGSGTCYNWKPIEGKDFEFIGFDKKSSGADTRSKH